MDIQTFCQFQQYGPYQQSQGFLFPCIEFGVVSASHLLLAVICFIQYFSIHVNHQITINEHFPSSLQFFYCAAFTGFSCFIQVFITLIPQAEVKIPSVILLSNSFACFIWLGIAFVFLINRRLILFNVQFFILPLFFTTLIFLLIFAQRCIQFGIFNPITIVNILPLTGQLILFCLILVRFLLNFQQRREEEQDLSITNGGLTTPLIHQECRGLSFPIIFSELFFLWTNKLIRKGYKGDIKQVDDVFELPNSLDLNLLGSVISFDTERTVNFAPTLFKFYGHQFFMLGILRFVGDIFKFASPILLHILIFSLQGQEFFTSYKCCALLFVTMLLASLCDIHFGYRINLLAIKAKAAVYEKLLRIPAYKISDEFSSGKLINLMCTDVDRISGFITSFHAFWSMPMNFIIALYLIYKEIGLSFLAGKFSNEMMIIKDVRMKIVSELSHSMRTIKLNCWENYFENKINLIRQRELTYLRYIKFLDAICVYLWASAPILITMMMLATSTLILNEQLTAAKVFTTLALINILILPLNAFPWVLGSIINGLDFKQFYSPISVNLNTILKLEGNSFAWKNGNHIVSGVKFEGEPGMLIGVMGPVGSGKSALLLGILGETIIDGHPILLNEEVISQGFAYVGQDVWLRTGTIQENILCEQSFCLERFRYAINVCALSMDIESMPGKEKYRIGEEGVTLSGGQKVRLALARAVYANKLIYLLDDPFAALDRSVANYVYENCVEKALKSKGKLVILCTHHERFLTRADLIIQINEEGQVLKVGSPEIILSNLTTQEDQNNKIEQNDDLLKPMEAAEFVTVEQEEEKEEGTVKIHVYKTYIRAIGLCLSGLVIFSLIVMQASKNGSDFWLSKWTSINGSDNNHTRIIIQQDWGCKLFLQYNFLIFFPLSPRRIFPLTSINDQDQSIFYLRIYISIVAINSFSTLLRAFLFAIACIYAAKYLHQHLLCRILKANINWWDKTPCGRVTNRLSSDVGIVDDALPFQLNIFLASIFSLIGTLVLTFIALPLLTPILLPLFVIYFYIQKYYRQTNIELKRIGAITLSPLYSHLSETVSGLVTIRSLRIIFL
ncbi:hypothetical protein Mgra_00001051 [Meloidogyne graminicola]|uniref:ABC-type xenobiotic transporter n=1 Tax=Meloidogyne graminicola TaxID=189291 RepID=A0A8T0A1I4_9BILA|nr:hypothetical protein Mgra_00001051 [Meloidogyne graminicola]